MIWRNVGRALLVAPLLFACATLPALAHASPPDPSWIAGIYDDADYDDVVTLVQSGAGGLAPAVPTDLAPIRRTVELLIPAPEKTTAALRPSAVHSRAPPAS